MTNIKKIKIGDYRATIIWNYLNIGINILAGFVFFPLILKYLGEKELGIFGLFYSIKSFIDIGIGWMSASIIKNLLKYNYLKDSIFTLSFLINSFYAIFCFLFFCIYGLLKGDIFVSSIYFGIFAGISFACLPFYELLMVNNMQSVVGFFKFLSQFLFFIFSFAIFFLSSEKGLSDIFLGLFIGSVATFIMLILYVKSNFNIAFDFIHISKALFGRIFFLDGKSIFLNSLLLIAILQIDVLLIVYLYGEEILAKYMIIYKIPNTLIMLGWRLSEPFGIVISRQIKKDKNSAYLNFLKIEKKILIAGLLVAFGYFFLGHLVLEVWLGDKIYEVKYMYIASSALIFLSIIQRLYFMTNFYTNGMNILNLLMIVELLCKILFILVLFNYFKEVSAILGWLFGLLITIYFYRKNSKGIFIDAKS